MMEDTSWENLSAEECVTRLKNGIERINQVHESGAYCYDMAGDWRRTGYAWHNPLLPPQYRRSCLNGRACDMNPGYEFYYFTAFCYEKMTGCRAPYDFGINLSWKKILKKRMEGWNMEYRKVVFDLIETYTKTRRCGS